MNTVHLPLILINYMSYSSIQQKVVSLNTINARHSPLQKYTDIRKNQELSLTIRTSFNAGKKIAGGDLCQVSILSLTSGCRKTQYHIRRNIFEPKTTLVDFRNLKLLEDATTTKICTEATGAAPSRFALKRNV